MFVQNFVCFSSAMVRREVFSHVGAFDPQWDLAIDYDLWLRVARHYEFDFVDEELVRYRTGHGNLSKKLADRVDTALSIMHRAERRRRIGERDPGRFSRGGTCLDAPHVGLRHACLRASAGSAMVLASAEMAVRSNRLGEGAGRVGVAARAWMAKCGHARKRGREPLGGKPDYGFFFLALIRSDS